MSKQYYLKNKYLRTETKLRIYKSFTRPVLTYGSECRTETQKTKQINESTEMKVLSKIVGKSLKEKIHSPVIREECEIEPINLWIIDRRLNWNDHIEWRTAD